MNGDGMSDKPILPKKAANKGGGRPHPAERVEGRGLAKGNPGEQTRFWTQGQIDLQHALDRIRKAAREDKEQRFTALWHHVYNVNRLREAYHALKREAAPGVDGETWASYGQSLEENLKALSERLRRGTYHARPVKRVYIPKADGRQRPIGITALEDKLVQRATVQVLEAVYEADFLGFSYGFRPGRGQHNALDAERFLAALRDRLGKFNLELSHEKTRLIEFGRSAARNRKARGEGKPETFNFLGFTHSCGRTRRGQFCVLRTTMAKRVRAKLKAVRAELRERLHRPIAETGQWLHAVVAGHYQYYGVPRNIHALAAFRHHVLMIWHWALRRRGDKKHRATWFRMEQLAQRWLPMPKITHPYPNHLACFNSAAHLPCEPRVRQKSATRSGTLFGA